MMPPDHVVHADVSGLPVSGSSSAWVASIGRDATFHMDFGSGRYRGSLIGMPYAVVGHDQPKVPVVFRYASESDPGPLPLPSDAPMEGTNDDHHLLVLDQSICHLHELWDASAPSSPGGVWTAGSGASWDLRSNALRPAGWTSADAAGLPILPTLVRYDEVAAGRIDHVLRMSAPVTRRGYLWPARHDASVRTDPSLPPFGAWFRLRSDFDTSPYGPQARVILDAMKTHGVILADHGPAWQVGGVPDERWDNRQLLALHALRGSDMVAVDQSSLMLDPNSAQVRG
ncbi:MAG: hypothetical protein R2698_12870 [Microthrixaceae bacterium]